MPASDAPFVFKGAMIGKLILAESGFTEIDWLQKDIDDNWTGVHPSNKLLIDTVNQALKN
jgi:hypothetical protein